MSNTFTGKPVAVTHSRGKGVTKDRPGTDFEYEKKYWRQKAASKGKTSSSINNSENPVIQETNSNTSSDPKKSESFHSMADIASCSYEARKVMCSI